MYKIDQTLDDYCHYHNAHEVDPFYQATILDETNNFSKRHRACIKYLIFNAGLLTRSFHMYDLQQVCHSLVLSQKS